MNWKKKEKRNSDETSTKLIIKPNNNTLQTEMHYNKEIFF